MAQTKKNSNITVTVINKRKVHLANSAGEELIAIADDKGKVFLSLDGSEEEEYMVEYPREDFLDLVLGLFPDNVAYSFEVEE